MSSVLYTDKNLLNRQIEDVRNIFDCYCDTDGDLIIWCGHPITIFTIDDRVNNYHNTIQFKLLIGLFIFNPQDRPNGYIKAYISTIDLYETIKREYSPLKNQEIYKHIYTNHKKLIQSNQHEPIYEYYKPSNLYSDNIIFKITKFQKQVSSNFKKQILKVLSQNYFHIYNAKIPLNNTFLAEY